MYMDTEYICLGFYSALKISDTFSIPIIIIVRKLCVNNQLYECIGLMRQKLRDLDRI